MQPLRIALVTALVAIAPVTAKAQASQRFEHSVEEINDQIENPCNGELIQLTGTVTVTTRRTVDANGVVHLASTRVPHIRGEGPSGEYIVADRQSLNDKFVDNELFPENLTSVTEFQLIGMGSAPNFLFTMVHRFLADADGTIRLEFIHDSGRCTGKV